ncbi:MAG: hypothetical protein ABFR63_01135 [Thermodesulfobacteriota bacterium]
MAFINIATVISESIRTLKKIAPPGGIELLSYKRNRGIAVIKKDQDLLEIREYGYEERKFSIHPDQLAKELKSMVKREFPRSRKVRLIKFSDPAELDRLRQKI